MPVKNVEDGRGFRFMGIIFVRVTINDRPYGIYCNKGSKEQHLMGFKGVEKVQVQK